MSTVVGVDLGKTGCRVEVRQGSEVVGRADSPGAPGLAEPNGVAAALEAVSSALDTALPAGGAGPLALASLAVGAAGAEAAPAAAGDLARALSGRLGGCQVAVTSDSVTAHVGALGGQAGTVLAVGTGLVALAVSGGGSLAQVDGWGPWLGDDGSGFWLGREALRAVLFARESRGPRTMLTEVAVARFGDLAALPRTLAADGHTARTTASWARDVLDAAAAGDAVAQDISRRAAQGWVSAAVSAAEAVGERRVTIVGGLASCTPLVEQWRQLLPAGLEVVAAAGTPLDGAVTLAHRRDLPHETRVVRVAGDVPAEPGGALEDVDQLATEQVRRDLDDLDLRDPQELVRLMLEAEASVPTALRAAAPQLTAAVRLAARALERGGRLLYVGAGTPGRLAALDAAECPPTFGTDPARVVAVLAGGTQAAARAVEGAEDDAHAGAHDLLALAPTPADLVVGITASGRTPYVLSALEAARGRGCPTVAIVNNPGSPAREGADVTIELLTGPELLSGSTRLKAGTSQKIALNVLSTCAMIGHGKTYGAWMVDVVASNEKLRRRASRMLREAAGVDDARAQEVLQAAGWRTKTALVALLADLGVEEAQALLDASSGRVRGALAAVPRQQRTAVP